MSIAKITSRGQITIPQSVREAIGAKEGDQILFSVTGDRKAVIEVLKKTKLTDLYASLRPSEPVPPPEEWPARIREHVIKEVLGGEEGKK